MNPNLTFAPAIDDMRTVDAPITLRLRAGSAVFAVRGEAWITQEGIPHDVILAAGDRFDVPTRAPLVVSATHGRVDLYVARPAAACVSASCNVHDFLRAQAAELRRAQTAGWLDALAHGTRSFLLRARTMLSSRARVPTH